MENKRSLKYLIVAACLALLVASIGGIVVGAQTPPAESSIKILGATLDLNDQVSIGYVVDADAVGYDAETKTVQHYVHIYDYNPTNDSKTGTKLENFKYQTYDDGSAYVIFFTKGYAVTNYSNDVYARVVEGDGEKVGEVKKAGVYEIANLMLKQGVSSNATKLVNALVKYHDAAYKVIKGTASPYKFVSVKDGYIVGEDGFNYTSAVVAAGTKITLADEIDEAAKGAILTGWSVGGLSVSNTDAVAVKYAGEYSPSYAFIDDVDYNPWVNGMYGQVTTAFTLINNGANGKPNYGDTNNDFTTLTSGSSTIAFTRWSAYASSIAKMSHSVAFKDVYAADTDANGYNEAIRTMYRDAITGEPYMKVAYNKQPPINAAGTAPSATPAVGHTISMLFDNGVQAGGYVDLSFDIMFPTIDENSNGTNNETEFYRDVKENINTGDPETVDMYGDYFTGHGADNPYMIRIPIALTNGTDAGNKAQNLMYLVLSAKIENGIVTGFYPRTLAGSSDKSKNNGALQENANFVDYKSQVFSLDEYHKITARIIPDADGNVKSVSIFIDNEHIETRTSAKLGTTGLSGLAVDGDAIIFGEDAYNYIALGHYGFGRFNGEYNIKNFNTSYGDSMTADDVKNAPNYEAEEIPDTVFPIVHSAATKGDATGESQFTATNLLPILDTLLLRNYNNKGSWVYDAKYDSYTVTNTVRESGTGTKAGNFNLHVTNPLKGLAEDQRDGVAVALEFDMTIPVNDFNQNGILSERVDFNDMTAGGINSSIGGWLLVGHGTGDGTGNATPSTGMVAAARVTKSNNAAAVNKWTFSSSGYMGGKLYADDKGMNHNLFASSKNAGEIAHVKFVMYPDTNGVIQQVDTYIDGVLRETRKNNAAVDKTGMAYTSTGSYNCSANIFNSPYLNFSAFIAARNSFNYMFADFNAYIVNTTASN